MVEFITNKLQRIKGKMRENSQITIKREKERESKTKKRKEI